MYKYYYAASNDSQFSASKNFHIGARTEKETVETIEHVINAT